MLRREDFHTEVWKRLTSSLRDRLQELRELNDAQSNGPERTASIRGSIEEVKRILALAQSASPAAAREPDTGYFADGDSFTGL